MVALHLLLFSSSIAGVPWRPFAALVPAALAVPLRLRLAAHRGVPEGHVLGVRDQLRHVVAGRAEQLLERDLQGQGSGAAEARSHHAQAHFTSRRGSR